MADYLIQDTTLDAIADAINAKTGGSSAMTPAQMVMEIGNIPSGTTLPLFIKHEAITVTSDRITAETGGNAKAFKDKFLPDVSASPIGYPTILVIVENTNNSEYAAQSAVRLSGVTDGTQQTMRTGVRKNRVGVEMNDPATYFYVGAGSVVHRYVFVREELTS